MDTLTKRNAQEADSWAREAAKLPIAFSQVREDPTIDEAVLAEVAPNARVFMIASGGDTAAALVSSGLLRRLHLVDMNPAQLALTEIKIDLLEQAAPTARLALLGHIPEAAHERPGVLHAFLERDGLPADIFGPKELVDRLGPDHAGRYEVLFHHLREHLREYRHDLEELLDLADPAEQARRVSPETPLGRALDEAFESVMRLTNLVCLFGEEATRNARQTFSSHFAARLRHVLATLPARHNPFLAQLLLGTFRNGATYDWFNRPKSKEWPEIFFTRAKAMEALASMTPGSIDFVHLSNILDWLSPEDGAKTLALAFRVLRPGGLTIIRQLNSTLDIPACEPRFQWRRDQAAALHQKDRSFFYRELFIGAKPLPQ